MLNLKQIILEEYNVIGETYESINELKKLVSEIFNEITENNLPYYNKDKKFNNYIFGTYLSAVNHNNYEILENFIKESGKLVIQIQPKESTKKGDYQSYEQYDGEKFDPRKERRITVYYDENHIKNSINEKYEEKGKIEHYELRSLFEREFKSALLHELQHAYDDYRSKGKIYQTKQWEDYLEKYSDKIDDAIKDSQITTLEKAKEYLNLPHEIWARFTQAISEVSFFEAIDINEETEKFIYEMKPLHNVIKNFKVNFEGFHMLSEKMKRKIIKRATAFWHLEQDKVAKLNKR